MRPSVFFRLVAAVNAPTSFALCHIGEEGRKSLAADTLLGEGSLRVSDYRSDQAAKHVHHLSAAGRDEHWIKSPRRSGEGQIDYVEANQCRIADVLMSRAHCSITSRAYLHYRDVA